MQINSIEDLLRAKDETIDYYKQENLELKETIHNYIILLYNIQHELTREEINLGNITFDNYPRADETTINIPARTYRRYLALEECLKKSKEHLKDIFSIS